MTAIKICKGCGYSFKPKLSDEYIRGLWFEEESVEYMEYLKSEYGYSEKSIMVKFPYPKEEMCDNCINSGNEASKKIKRLMPPM